VGAELAALVRVEPALEQGAKDRRLDLPPVQGRHPPQQGNLFPRERHDLAVREQAAIKIENTLSSESTARGHCAEEIGQHPGEFFWVALALI